MDKILRTKGYEQNGIRTICYRINGIDFILFKKQMAFILFKKQMATCFFGDSSYRMHGIISICIDENNPSLTEKEAQLMQGTLIK